MPRKAILAIDQGTTNTKALLVGEDGAILATAAAPTHTDYPRPGWAEQSTAGIWASVTQAVSQVAATPDCEIIGIGISNQRESALLWDALTSESVGPCVIWQCRRSAELCADLRSRGLERTIQSKSGLGLDPLFSAGKWHWLLDHIPEARALLEQGRLRAGTVDSWLLWKLTGGAIHATDTSNAARTQLMALETGQWDANLAGHFGIPLPILPDIRSSDAHFGVATALMPGVPILAVMGDSHAALFGHGIDAPGRVKVTLGTGSSLMATTSARPRSTHGLSETVAWNRGGAITYALEGNITVSGHAAAFAAEMLGLADAEALTALAGTVPDSGGVTFLPALAGLGAPHWDAETRGVISGLTLATRPAHIARAALEGIAHQIADVVQAMEADLGAPVAAIHADGGAARNALLIQMIADFTGRPVRISEVAELSAYGVAQMAAYGLGKTAQWQTVTDSMDIQPAENTARIAESRRDWSRAIARAKASD